MKQQDISELKLYLQSLPRLADKDKGTRVKRAYLDFWFFIQTYFPHHVEHAKTETSRFRRFVQSQLYDLSGQHNKLLFTAYRGVAKPPPSASYLPSGYWQNRIFDLGC